MRTEELRLHVPASSTNTFKKYHTGSGITSEDKYYNRVVFLEGTGEIITKGAVFGGNLEEAISQAVDQSVTKIVDGAPEALDTLKELADWMANDDGKNAASIVAAVNSNTTSIGEPAKAAVGAEGDENYQPATPATGLYAEIEKAACQCQECTLEQIESLKFE